MIGSWLLVLSGALILGGAPPDASDAYRIIVNAGNPTSSLSRSQLSRMFLDPTTWDNGQPVLPVDLTPTSPVRDVFSKAVHGMPTAAVIAHWTNASAAGGKTPLTLGSDADVIQYVRLKLGAIGYVSPGADVSAVKVLSIDRTSSTETASGAPEALIQTVLTKYVSALEGRDLIAIKRLWPTMNGAQMRALRAEFDQMRALRVELLDQRVDIKDDKAVVVARRRDILVTSSGTTMRVVTQATLDLRRDAGGWTIEDARYQAQR